jgi:hypothetical protein
LMPPQATFQPPPARALLEYEGSQEGKTIPQEHSAFLQRPQKLQATGLFLFWTMGRRLQPIQHWQVLEPTMSSEV